MKDIKIAIVQLASTESIENNIQLATTLITEAAEQGAKIIALPEEFLTVALPVTAKLTIAEEYGSGSVQQHFRALSKKLQIYLVAGTISLKSPTDQKVYSSCLIFDPQGQIVSRYDKIHLFDVKIDDKEEYTESATVVAGDKVVTFSTEYGNIGLAICYDLRFPELFRAMLDYDVEIIIVPAAFTYRTGKAHWELLLKARAVENLCYVIGAGQSGHRANGEHTYGHSMIISPWAEVISSAELGSDIIYATLDATKLHKLRENFPVLQHRKIPFKPLVKD